MNIHVVNHNTSAIEVLNHLNSLTDLITLIVEDDDNKIIGSISDGDIRRGIISGNSINDKISFFINKKFNYLKYKEYNFSDIKKLREKGFNLIPILKKDKTLHDIIILKEKKNILPISAIIMAGGLGSRLYPITKNCPKPLIKIGNKQVIDYTLDLLLKYGINDLNFCLNFQHEKFLKYFENLSKNKINIRYVLENKRMGTIGGISLFDDFINEHILIINADIVTDIDLEQFYETFLKQKSDLCIATRYFTQNIPYAVIKEKRGKVTSIKEKPEVNFQINSGIYILKKSLLKNIPKNTFYDATDFIRDLIKNDHNVNTFNFLDKWIDIGSHKDLKLFKNGDI